MGKRIRHPKDKIQKKNKKEEKTHFVLDVHNGSLGNKAKIGN